MRYIVLIVFGICSLGVTCSLAEGGKEICHVRAPLLPLGDLEFVGSSLQSNDWHYVSAEEQRLDSQIGTIVQLECSIRQKMENLGGTPEVASSVAEAWDARLALAHALREDWKDYSNALRKIDSRLEFEKQRREFLGEYKTDDSEEISNKEEEKTGSKSTQEEKLRIRDKG